MVEMQNVLVPTNDVASKAIRARDSDVYAGEVHPTGLTALAWSSRCLTPAWTTSTGASTTSTIQGCTRFGPALIRRPQVGCRI